MDRYGIEGVLLPPCQVLSSRCENQYLCSDAVLSEFFLLIYRYPQRFSTFTGYNAHDIKGSLLWMEEAVRRYRVKGLYVSGAASIPLLDRRMYPAYSKCDELRVPVTIRLDREVASAASWPALEDVRTLAGDFPELTVVAACGSWPSLDGLRRLLETRENVYVALDANPGNYVERQAPGFLNSELGKNRCMWGSNGCDWDVALSQLDTLGLEQDTLIRFARENAIAIFDLAQQEKPYIETAEPLTAE
jgi:predicted TIM-barrel fold metal-dependent hydrolase